MTKLAILGLTLFAGATVIAAPLADLSALDAFVRTNQAKFGVPGIAVGVVQNGKLIYAKGFGFRDVENKLPVTSQTLFGLGSTSKAFAGVTVAAMVDDGKLKLDEPVHNYLPDFQLASGTAQAHASVRDLLLHRVGQARHDTMWLGTPFDRPGIFKRLGFFDFNLSFREKWQYSNLMYMAAGHLAERVGGTSWENLVKTRIFNPLGMDGSNTSVSDSQRERDFAQPYKISGVARVRRGFRVVDNMGPAGSVNSSVDDMAHWLNYQSSGESDGRVLSGEMLAESQRGQIAVPNEPYDAYSEFTPTKYAFAWKTQRYRGTLLRRHGGDLGGFLATVAVLPELNAGVVVLQNIDHFGLNNYIALRAYDLLLGKAPIDWLGRLNGPQSRSSFPKVNASVDEEHLFWTGAALPEAVTLGDVDPRGPPLPLASYAGIYDDAGYGALTLRMESGQLRLAYNDWQATLTHSTGNVFKCAGGFSGNATFNVNARGKVTRVALPFEATVAAITFDRR